MITEVGSMLYAIKLNGQLIVQNIPSRSLAEATMFNLPPEQRALAEIIVVTDNGKSLLLG